MLRLLRWSLVALVLAAGLAVAAALMRPAARDVRAAAESASSGAPSAAPAHAPPGAVVLNAGAPAAQIGAPQNVLVEALVGDIRKLNPLLATFNPVDRDITALIFEGLATTNEFGEIVPDLAESWTMSDDGLEYLVVLRGDVLWQDGIAFTADDVAFTVAIMSDPHFPGAAMLHEFWRTVEVDAVSTTMVRFRLTQPLASFPDYLRIGIVPAHVLAGSPMSDLAHHPFNLAPIGTGPYQLEERYATDGQLDGVGLRVAPVYRERPEGREGYLLDRIVFRTYPTTEAALEALQRGEVNSLGEVPPSLLSAASQTSGASLFSGIAPQVGVLIYNWEGEGMRFVRNPRARLALAHAFDRRMLVDEYLEGRAIVADSPILPTSWAYAPGMQWPQFDPARAQALLETADLTFEVPAEGDPAPDDGESPVSGEDAADDDAGTPVDETPAAEQGEAASAESVPSAEDGSAPSEGEDSVPGDAVEILSPDDEESSPEPAATPSPQPTREPMTFALLTRDDPALIALAEEIAVAWEALGFTVRLESAPPDMLLARLEQGDFDAALIELSFEPHADPDPFVFWHQGQYQRGQNYGGMDDRRISEALELARRDPYGINRIVHYQTFQEVFAERAPAVVLYYPLYFYAADERLEGVQLSFLSSPADRFRTIQDWHFIGE